MSQRLILAAALLIGVPAGAQTVAMPVFSPQPGTVTAPAAKQAPPAKPFLGPPFSDHAVLQRDMTIMLWGWATPRTGVVATIDGSTAKGRADHNGRWLVKLPPHKAGGPYTLFVTGSDGRDLQLTDIMIGDVWLCSGQSNMEFPLKRAENGEAVVAGASDEALRLFRVPVAASDQPAEELATPTVWTRTSPATAADFSAACFFMGRDIAKATGVSVGLIDASRGGSAITPWLSAEALKALGGYDRELAALKLHAKSVEHAEEAYRLQMDDWWTGAGSNAPVAADFDDSLWPETPATQIWEGWGDPDLAHFDGVMWYRTRLNLTQEQVRGAAVLALGTIDDVDQTSVNGFVVGSTRGYDVKRTYRLPEGLLKVGSNVIVVRVLDTGGGGGLYGDASTRSITFADGTVLSLPGPWRWQKGPSLQDLGRTPVRPWDGITGLTTLYNGMIAPLEPYGLKGFAWYQGETDVGAADRYAKLLPALISDWRGRFGAKPFLIVQLAGYGARASAPADPAIARLREVQRRTAAADPDAAVATAVDIGNPNDIHPTNKQELGRRLAFAAREVAYGAKVDGSGPQPLSAVQDGDVVIIKLQTVGATLRVLGGSNPVGFELCPVGGQCRFADAVVDGQTIQIKADSPIASVRYLWQESPIVNLYDVNQLPVLPFELPVTQETVGTADQGERNAPVLPPPQP